MNFRIAVLILAVLASGCATTAPEPVSAPSQTVTEAPAAPYTDQLIRIAEIPPAPAAAPRETDLWQRIRDGFALPGLSNKYVASHRKWYANRPDYMIRVVERAQPYLYYIVEEIEKRGMPTEIALLPAVESAFRPTAYSRAHAAGLWQFIPGTARQYKLKMNWWYDSRRDVVESTRAALDYLEFLHQEFNGDWFHALAAYNAGENGIQRAINKNKSRGRPTNYSSLRLNSETRHYVPKLIALKQIVQHPDRYSIELAAIPNEPYFTAVDTPGQIDLNVVRELSGVDEQQLRHLNAGFKRWATDPDGPHRILVPLAEAPGLQQALADLPDSARLRWGHYTIRNGDTLGQIARKYGISVSALQRSNNLKGTLIRAGADLLIPLSPGAATGPGFQAADPGVNAVVHRVRSGDTLWAIARRYNVYITQITRWNSIGTHDLLHLGQNIVVYVN